MSFDFFDKVYCIHLPNDKRREAIEKEFQRVGIHDVTFVHAQQPYEGFRMSNMRRGVRGEFGCSLSHIKAAMIAIDDGAYRPLFLEDDVIFKAPERMRAIEKDLDLFPYWEVLYLGGHPREPCHWVTDNLVEVKTFSFAESYALRGDRMTQWVQFWLDRVGQPNAMVDLILGEFAALHYSYCVYPLMTYQPPGISQISNKPDNKDSCLEKGWTTNLCEDLSIRSA